ncbi:MAG: penicillin acylase family protein [Acidobacteria bacterium]|nr:penicillin acylase family protein [Acidobacteriota bacterium]
MRVRQWLPTGHRVAAVVLIAAGIVLATTAAGYAQAPAGAADLKALAKQSLSKIDGEISVPGVKEPVEVIRDKWGITHIYAKNQDDMFYAQGYVAGQDRLWQLYMWRMTNEGRLAEILGPAAVDEDRAKRMAMYRRPIDDEEWTSYHPDGKRIFTAWTDGLNAYIEQAMSNLPVEFKLTGLKPEPWKPETPLLRSAGLGGMDEINLARLVARVGAKEATRQRMPDPWAEIEVPIGLDLSRIGDDVQWGGRGGSPLPKPEIAAPYRALFGSGEYVGDMVMDFNPDPGSNNWVIGTKYANGGRPQVANDPHRQVGTPSLRYIFHLVSPGWNVIGAQEAPFVGVGLGHNERVAWGLTIAGNDQADVFVEETNPANANQMLYLGRWEQFQIVKDSIRVKGEAAPRTIEFKVGRHGPIVFEDAKNHRAYAVRTASHEPGTAPYLAGLRLSQAADCRDFLDRAMYWKAPTENLICGDVDGNIGEQSSALTPVRRGWDGRMPVPGTGEYEWTGFRQDLPRRWNPVSGYIATANNNINVTGYWPPVAFKSLASIPTERVTRVEQVINDIIQNRRTKFTIDDSKLLQHDAYMLQASFDQDLFRGWTGRTPDVEKARAMVAGWNAVLDKTSAAAAIYQTWRQAMSDPKAYDFWRPLEERRPLVEPGLAKAIQELTETQGPDWNQWRWGRMHTQSFAHPFVSAYDLPTLERSGGTGTPFAGGASYREIMDTGNWDRSVATNVPGQSGQPESPYYGNLLPLWDRQEYFPMAFTRGAVDAQKEHTLVLKPSAVPSSALR